MDREAWRAAIHGVTQSQTRLSNRTELSPVPPSILQFRILWSRKGKRLPCEFLAKPTQSRPKISALSSFFFFSLSFSLPCCPPLLFLAQYYSLFFFHLFVNPMVIDGKEIRALSSRSEGKGVVSSSSPSFLTDKGCVWRKPLSFLPQRLCSFPPAPPHLWRGLYNVLGRLCIGLARWLAYRHPAWEDSLPQFCHPQKGMKLVLTSEDCCKY